MAKPYVNFIAQWKVVRVSDGKVVAPCASDQDPDFLEYIDWINEGNEPDIDETPEELV